MAATNLISLTRTSDGVTVKVGSTQIAYVEPVGSGSRVYLSWGSPNNDLAVGVNETPAQILTAANA